MTGRTVLQMIDSPRRDMEWRIYVAAKLASAGLDSIIGSPEQIERVHAASRHCIFLGRLGSNTGRTAFDRRLLESFAARNTALFFLHDEGGFYLRGEYESSVRRVHPGEYIALPVMKRMFFWGEAQRRVFAEHPEQHKLMVTGAPRFDLCRETHAHVDRSEEARLKARYGDFVLVCCRFAAVNMVHDDPGVLGQRSYQIRVEGGSSQANTREAVLLSMFDLWQKVNYEFAYFVPAIARLAIAQPDLNFVVRPHPAERLSFYEEAFSHFPNVFVDKNGDVRSVIRASRAVVHSECTTAVESEIACRPSINFRPTAGMPEYEPFTVAGVDEIGEVVRTSEDLLRSLARLRQTGFNFKPGSADVSQYLRNVGSEPEASDLIVEEIKAFCAAEMRNSELEARRDISTFELKRWVKNRLRHRGAASAKPLPEGDTKAFAFPASHLQALWHSFGGADGGLQVRDGLVYTSATV